jgi:hypothetical protein
MGTEYEGLLHIQGQTLIVKVPGEAVDGLWPPE